MKSDMTKPSPGVLALGSQEYPNSVAEALKKPMPLYYRGRLSLLRSPRLLSVVGSRETTVTSQNNLRLVLRDCRDLPLTIVSGCALGLDALAHTIALEQNLPTIAVLGSSVEPPEIYPATNRNLAERIVASGGLLLSPFPPGTRIDWYNFPIRNQVIAALGQVTLIASAAKKSGALITAQLALEYGKEVSVIPGNPTDPLYAGSNRLLHQGAYPVVSSEDILSLFGLTARPQTRTYTPENAIEQRVLAVLKEHNRTINEIASHAAIPVVSASLVISKFEIKGWTTTGSDGTISLV